MYKLILCFLLMYSPFYFIGQKEYQTDLMIVNTLNKNKTKIVETETYERTISFVFNENETFLEIKGDVESRLELFIQDETENYRSFTAKQLGKSDITLLLDKINNQIKLIYYDEEDKKDYIVVFQIYK